MTTEYTYKRTPQLMGFINRSVIDNAPRTTIQPALPGPTGRFPQITDVIEAFSVSENKAGDHKPIAVMFNESHAERIVQLLNGCTDGGVKVPLVGGHTTIIPTVVEKKVLPLAITEALPDGGYNTLVFDLEHDGPFLIGGRHYAERDPEALLPEYEQHVMAMTAERLHAKSDIAAELAWRDRVIRKLRNVLFKVLSNCVKDPWPLDREHGEDLATTHVPHSCAGFYGAFVAEHGRNPTSQEVWNAAIRSYRLRNTAGTDYVPSEHVQPDPQD